jgi:hypothetical protein
LTQVATDTPRPRHRQLATSDGPGSSKIKTSGQQWGRSAQIVNNVNGAVRLKDQFPELQAVLRESIQFMLMDLIFCDAYPLIESRTGFARIYLHRAAKNRGESALEIKQRVKHDPRDFVYPLQELVRRLSQYQ